MDPLLNLATKAEVDRIKSARSVREALATQGDALVIVLAPKFDPELFPEPGTGTTADIAWRFAAQLQASTPRRLIDRSIDWLDRIEAKVVTRGRAYRTLKVSRLSANRNLRRVAEKAATAVIGVRDQVFSVYGEEVAVDLGFARVTPTAPGDVLENCLHLEGRLSNPPELPEPGPGRLPIGLKALLGALAPLFRELERAMAEYRKILRESQTALFGKRRAIKAFDMDFRYLSGTAENMFELAGMPEEAQLVRPSTRRRGVTQAVNGEQGDPPTGDDTTGDDVTGQAITAEATTAEATTGPQTEAQAISDEGQETLSDDSFVVTAVSAEEPAEE